MLDKIDFKEPLKDLTNYKSKAHGSVVGCTLLVSFSKILEIITGHQPSVRCCSGAILGTDSCPILM